ncbi:MAG: HAD hydrolase family protein [Phycisphaerales bacterium]
MGDAARQFSDPASIELFVFDVDGVLTDGSINIDDDGRETKRFHVRDGYGFKLWRLAGFKAAIITGRTGAALLHRLETLKVPDEMIIQGSKDKSAALDEIIARSGVDESRIAYMGDDWLDIPPMLRVGLPIAPADAEAEVRAVCAMVTARAGGHGAAREAIAHVLGAKGLYTPPG